MYFHNTRYTIELCIPSSLVHRHPQATINWYQEHDLQYKVRHHSKQRFKHQFKYAKHRFKQPHHPASLYFIQPREGASSPFVLDLLTTENYVT